MWTFFGGITRLARPEGAAWVDDGLLSSSSSSSSSSFAAEESSSEPAAVAAATLVALVLRAWVAGAVDAFLFGAGAVALVDLAVLVAGILIRFQSFPNVVGKR